MMILAVFVVVFFNVAGSCSPPFEPIDGVGCYYYNPDVFVQSYDGAANLCADLGGFMGVVKSGAENRAIIENLLLGNVVGDRVLLGASVNEMGLFEWIDGSLVRDGFDSWDTLQPSGDGECMGYSRSSLNWDDFPCDNYIQIGFIGFLCEQDPTVTTTEVATTTTSGEETTTSTTAEPTTTFTTAPPTTTFITDPPTTTFITDPPTTTFTTAPPTTTFITDPPTTTIQRDCPEGFDDPGVGCYHISPGTMDWPSGVSYCEDLGAHMAYITSELEQNALEVYLDENVDSDDVFIGEFDIYNTDDMHWLDGTRIKDGYSNFASEAGGIHDGVYMIREDGWSWGHTSLIVPDRILCEIDL